MKMSIGLFREYTDLAAATLPFQYTISIPDSFPVSHHECVRVRLYRQSNDFDMVVARFMRNRTGEKKTAR